MTTTREAIIISDRTGRQVWEIDPIPLPVNDAGEVTDSGPLDAVLEALEADDDPRHEDSFGGKAHAVWYDDGSPVLCAD